MANVFSPQAPSVISSPLIAALDDPLDDDLARQPTNSEQFTGNSFKNKMYTEKRQRGKICHVINENDGFEIHNSTHPPRPVQST